MKRPLFIALGVLFAFSLLFAGCSQTTTPNALNISPAISLGNLTGPLVAINTTASHTNDTITILTASGRVTLPVTPNTTYNLNSQFCSLLDLTTTMQQGNTTYLCTAIYDTTYGVTMATVWTAQNQTGP